MEDTDHTHRPSQQVLDRIVQTFAAEGYSIVIELGNAIPHQDMINLAGSPSSSPEVQAIRNVHFAHRSDPRYFYSIWAHEYNSNPPGSSGNADLPGRIHLVTLGSFPGQVGTMNHQVGTFIHELGHNLGQRHGGADHSNFKPNYVSVMNYHFQLSGIGPILQALGLANSSQGFNDFGYSHGALPPLDESRLDERVGIGLGRAVDWNCDGDSTDVNISKDLQEGSWCGASGGLATITDFDNWGSINDFVQAGPAAFGVAPPQPSEPCINWEQHQALLRGLGAVAESTPPPVLAAAVDPGPGFTIFNDGTSDLLVNSITKVTPASWIGWTPELPFVIPAGESRLVIVTVDFTQAPVGQSTNRLAINSNDPDGDAMIDIVVVNQATTANLIVTQEESAEPASVTCPLSYTILVTNRGPTAATGVIVTNQLPAGALFDAASSSQGSVSQGGLNVVAQLGTIPFGGSATVTVTVTPVAPTSLTNVAVVVAEQVDPDPSNNVVTEITQAFIDTTGPVLVAAVAQPEGNSILVRFSEPVSATALNPDRYTIIDGMTNPVPILALHAGPTPQTVVLEMNLLTRFGPFSITASNVTDCLGNPSPSAGGEVYIGLPAFNFITARSVWKYLDDGSDQGAAWRSLTFNDSAWASGAAELGYGDSDEETEVDFGPDSQLKFVTTYFRKTFVLEDASKLTNASVHLVRDDGAIVYLNGTEVVRSNMPPSSTSATLALNPVDGTNESTFFTSRINSTLLRTGTNVVAVEIHQSGRASSDISFDLALTAGLRVQAVRPTFLQQPESQFALVGDTVAFTVSVVGTPPINYRWRFNGSFVAPGQFETSSLTLTNVQLTNTGMYSLLVSNPATPALFSAQAALSVMADMDADRMGDAWEAFYGFASNEPADAASDADDDGMSNRDEFIAGTNPRDSQSFLKIDAIAPATNGFNLQFTAVSNRSYSVLYRDNAPAGSWLRLTNALGRNTNRIEVVVDPARTNGQRWYRLTSPKTQ